MSRSAIIRWAPSPDIAAEAWLLERFDEPVGPWVPVVETSATEHRADGLPDDAPTTFRVRPIVAGILAPEDRSALVSYGQPTSALPPAITGLVAAQVGPRVVVQWAAIDPSPLWDVVEIREGATWDTAIRRAEIPATLTRGEFGWLSATQVTYLARLRDVFGRYGGAAASVTHHAQRDPYWTLQNEEDESGGGFAGTKSDTAVSGGELRLADRSIAVASLTDPVADVTWPVWASYDTSGTYVTDVWDAGTTVIERLEVEIASSAVGAAPTVAQMRMPVRETIDENGDAVGMNHRGIAQRMTLDGYDVDGLGLRIEIATSTSDSPPDTYVEWIPEALYRYRYVRLRVTLSGLGFWTPSIATLKWRAYRMNRKAEGKVEIGSTGIGGTTVTFPSGHFSATPSVIVSAEEATMFAEVVPASPSASEFKVRLRDDTGAEQTGTVHWIAAGV